MCRKSTHLRESKPLSKKQLHVQTISPKKSMSKSKAIMQQSTGSEGYGVGWRSMTMMMATVNGDSDVRWRWW